MEKRDTEENTFSYAVCRRTPDCVSEDAYLCRNVKEALDSVRWYIHQGDKVWIESRHICIHD